MPPGLVIGVSDIQGQGLFTVKPIRDNTILGITHHIVDYEIIRTPLGGFLNHSENPNCELIENGTTYILRSIKNIPSNSELTVKYSIEQ